MTWNQCIITLSVNLSLLSRIYTTIFLMIPAFPLKKLAQMTENSGREANYWNDSRHE